ncbi:hypothetical protein GOP47_0020098 [Adiantum capillus-veneris]|uniref:Uncharacterized protein n=1 Tax=Adiantum capillus-veneris TaxID=13818 RepID=A0A9D4UDA6_ADICA|nr:hypothetical protein GOP47_0020098 [Adiantum capillus-veneris]
MVAKNAKLQRRRRRRACTNGGWPNDGGGALETSQKRVLAHVQEVFFPAQASFLVFGGKLLAEMVAIMVEILGASLRQKEERIT